MGFIAGQGFGAAVVVYPSGDHTLWSGVWESGNVTLVRMALQGGFRQRGCQQSRG